MAMAEVGPRRRGRQRPADAHRRRRRGPRALPGLVRGRGLHYGARRDGHDVRPPRGRRPGGGAGLRRQPPRHPADGRPLRPASSACLGGLEVVRTLNDLGITTRRPIVVANWTNEEGTRFAPAMLASGVFAGVHELDWALGRTDAAGLRFGDELARIGWQGDEPVGARPIHAMFELHIEQGPDPRGGGLRDRRRHARAGALVARDRAHRPRRAHRLDADGDARRPRASGWHG